MIQPGALEGVSCVTGAPARSRENHGATGRVQVSAQRRRALFAGFGPRLRALRLKRGWRQGDLARRAGLSQGAVARYEVGLSRPRRATLRRLAHVLEADEVELARLAAYVAPSASVPCDVGEAGSS